MPTLDRRITVRRTVQGTNAFGEYEETTTDYPVWASVSDLSAFDVESEGGTFTNRLRKWGIRWRADFAAIETAELSVIEGGLVYNVQNLVRQSEGEARRRMMSIEGVAVP